MYYGLVKAKKEVDGKPREGEACPAEKMRC